MRIDDDASEKPGILVALYNPVPKREAWHVAQIYVSSLVQKSRFAFFFIEDY